MKALSAFAGAVGCAVVLFGGPATSVAQPATTTADPMVRARQRYNAGEYDAAIEAARDAASRPATRSEANLLLGRALLERHRASRTPEDLSAGRQALAAVDAGALDDRGRVDLVVGLGEALYLDGEYGAAAGLLEPVLEQMGLLPAPGREQVLDWWATAMDRYAQPRPPEERGAVYDRVTTRMRAHLGRYADSAAASYWLPAAALARGDLDVAWDLALAGWVRALLAHDKGAALRADLDRLVTEALIPERVKRLPDDDDSTSATERFTAEWEEAKSQWK